jgi:hypothetical protein
MARQSEFSCAIFLESPGQGSLTLRIVRLFAGDVFAELKPALQRCHYITRLRRDGCTIRKQGKSCYSSKLAYVIRRLNDRQSTSAAGRK